MSLQIPTQGLSENSQDSLAALLLEKTRLKSRLLYNLNKTDLREFVSDASNNFLVAYFTQNCELGETEPYCKVEALQSLIHFGKYYD